MNWSGMDRIRDYARANGIPYKAHTLVWGAQQPGWIAGLPQSEQRAEVEEWIREFCTRYPDVAMIDVVNEFTMFWNHPSVRGITLWGYVRGSTWLPNSGLMSSSGQMRPAMSWLMTFLGR